MTPAPAITLITAQRTPAQRTLAYQTALRFLANQRTEQKPIIRKGVPSAHR